MQLYSFGMNTTFFLPSLPLLMLSPLPAPFIGALLFISLSFYVDKFPPGSRVPLPSPGLDHYD